MSSLCLLIWIFNPFTFKIIINKYDPFAIYFVVWVHFYKTLLCFMSREDPLAFVEDLVWWLCIPSAFTCLSSFWFLLHIWMRSLLGRIILLVDFSLTLLLHMFCYSFLTCRVSIERSAVFLWISLCVLFIAFPLLLLIFALCVGPLLVWITVVTKEENKMKGHKKMLEDIMVNNVLKWGRK